MYEGAASTGNLKRAAVKICVINSMLGDFGIGRCDGNRACCGS